MTIISLKSLSSFARLRSRCRYCQLKLILARLDVSRT
jgi:hypothetical protein